MTHAGRCGRRTCRKIQLQREKIAVKWLENWERLERRIIRWISISFNCSTLKPTLDLCAIVLLWSLMWLYQSQCLIIIYPVTNVTSNFSKGKLSLGHKMIFYYCYYGCFCLYFIILFLFIYLVYLLLVLFNFHWSIWFIYWYFYLFFHSHSFKSSIFIW